MANDRPRLLIIDDEPEVLRSLGDLFRLDYAVTARTSAAEAVAALESSEEFAAIITDQRMPGMTGVELLGEAMRLQPDATRILLTAYADIKSVIDAINKGRVFRYVSKPWDPAELDAIVRQAVEQYRLIKERNALIRELQETNAQLRKTSRLKQAFLEIASHELNTPVTVILGMIEIRMLTQLATAPDSDRTWMERLHKAGKRLASTVERMLKILRCEQLKRTLELCDCKVEELVKGVVADLEPFLAARRQSARVELEPDLGSATIDLRMIEDVLINLIGNAIKFTPDSGVIMIRGACSGPDHFRIEVIDSGAGIADADQQHLFEPFFTGYDTMHHSSGDYHYGKRGIGIGLFMVKTFVELHGGVVDFSSGPGRGSIFGFTLPRIPAGSRKAFSGELIQSVCVDDAIDLGLDAAAKVT